MTHIFENPTQFIEHLERKLADLHSIPHTDMISLLQGSVHALKYLVHSQAVHAHKLHELISCLNDDHPSWGHKLAEVYGIMEAATVTPEQMNRILSEEVKSESDHQN